MFFAKNKHGKLSTENVFLTCENVFLLSNGEKAVILLHYLKIRFFKDT